MDQYHPSKTLICTMTVYTEISYCCLKYRIQSFKCIARLYFYSALLSYNIDYILLWSIVLMPSVLHVLSLSIVWQFFLNIKYIVLSWHFIKIMVFFQLKFNIFAGCDTAFIVPMHHNKRNIYLLTEISKQCMSSLRAVAVSTPYDPLFLSLEWVTPDRFVVDAVSVLNGSVQCHFLLCHHDSQWCNLCRLPGLSLMNLTISAYTELCWFSSSAFINFLSSVWN